MRYRRVTFRSTRLRTGQPWPFAGAWEHESLRLLLQARWRPAADMSETATAIEVTVDLAGVDEDDFEVQLFENGLVVEGRRQLPSCGEDAVYTRPASRRASSVSSCRCRRVSTPTASRRATSAASCTSRCRSARSGRDGGPVQRRPGRLHDSRRAARSAAPGCRGVPAHAVPLLVQTPSAIRVIDDVMRGNRLLVFVAQRKRYGGARHARDHPSRREPWGRSTRWRACPTAACVRWCRGSSASGCSTSSPRIRTSWRGSSQPASRPSRARGDGLRRAVLDLFRRLVEVSSDLPDELAVAAESLVEPRQVVYFVASLVRMDTAARQALLEVDSIAEKLRRLVDVLQGELTVREDRTEDHERHGAAALQEAARLHPARAG